MLNLSGHYIEPLYSSSSAPRSRTRSSTQLSCCFSIMVYSVVYIKRLVVYCSLLRWVALRRTQLIARSSTAVYRRIDQQCLARTRLSTTSVFCCLLCLTLIPYFWMCGRSPRKKCREIELGFVLTIRITALFHFRLKAVPIIKLSILFRLYIMRDKIQNAL